MKQKIACPKCDWEPKPHSRWICSCQHIWNTFDTGGQCPSCGTVWKDTQCLSCHEWSPHIDWYREWDEWLEEELNNIEIIAPATIGLFNEGKAVPLSHYYSLLFGHTLT